MKKIDWNEIKKRAPKPHVPWSEKEIGVLQQALKHGIKNGVFLKKEFGIEFRKRTARAIRLKLDQMIQENK